MVGWEATGCAMGAYENAVKYCRNGLQYSASPSAHSKMVQDLLARMLANIIPLRSASWCAMSQLDAEGKMSDAPTPHRWKAFTTAI